MEDVINVVCPQKLKNLSALDVLSDVHGRVNFQLLYALFIDAYQLVEGDLVIKVMLETLINDLQLVEDFLKCRTDGLWAGTHFGGGAGGNHATDCGPASHCSFFIFGREDPAVANHSPAAVCKCGHEHLGSCVACERVMQVMDKVDALFISIDVKLRQRLSDSRASTEWKQQIEVNKIINKCNICVCCTLNTMHCFLMLLY
jgi:hypothetical protein